VDPSYTNASGADSVGAVSTRAFLQQAVDHYPRLAAFCFMLDLPYRETINEYRALILRFHTEVWQRIGEYSYQRQQARRHSPPTILRWLWEGASAPGCNMILLMNLNTLGEGYHSPLNDNSLQDMNEMLCNAWLAVSDASYNAVTKLTTLVINRAGCGTFLSPFNQLKTRVQAMESPVVMGRTGTAG